MMCTTVNQPDNIHDLYQNMLKISSALLNDFTDENVALIIQKRNDLLENIDNSLKKIKDEFNGEFKIDQETREVIVRIIGVDKSIIYKIQTRLDQIRKELNGLYKSSRATIAYSAYGKKLK